MLETLNPSLLETLVRSQKISKAMSLARTKHDVEVRGLGTDTCSYILPKTTTLVEYKH